MPFDPGLGTARDRARFAVGDTDNTAPLEPDTTYDAAIALYGEEVGTATIAEGLAARYGQEPDSFSSDGTSISWRSRVTTWLALAKRLREQAAAVNGSTSGRISTVQAVRDDPDTDEYHRGCRGWFTD